MAHPVIYMLAGPNGAGKTTAAMKLLPDFLSVHEFVNADEIARGLNPLNPAGQAVAAGRLMLERIDLLIAARKSFSFETTGSSKIFADKIKQARAAGFAFGLIFLWLPSVELAKQRVRLRVLQGGHDVPARDIERRFTRGLRNLVDIYLPLADQAHIVNCGDTYKDFQKVVAQKQGGSLTVLRDGDWRAILDAAKGSGNV